MEGIFIGLTAALLNALASLLNSFREGYCTVNILFDKQTCCSTLTEDYECQEFFFWRNNHSVFVSCLIYVSVSVGFAFIATILGYVVAPAARASGIPTIKAILSGYKYPDMNVFFSIKTLCSKSLAVCFSVASGLWVGKEGPFVHIATNIIYLVERIAPSLADSEIFTRQLLAAAMASGIAASFNAPVGGVIFALEQLASSSFPSLFTGSIWYEFLCSASSVVALQLIRSWHTDVGYLSYVSLDRRWSYKDTLPFIFISILCGCLGSVLIYLNMKFASKTKGFSKISNVFFVIFLSLITSLTAYAILGESELLFNPMELFPQVINSCSPSSSTVLCETTFWVTAIVLFTSALLGLLLTSATFGAAIPTGIIVPSLAIGACIGRAVGTLLKSRFPSLAGTSIYGVIGSIAFLSSTTRLVVALVVILFELTGALNIALPLMLATLISKWVSDSIIETSIYDAWIQFRNIPYFPSSNSLKFSIPLNFPVRSPEQMVRLPIRSCSIEELERAMHDSSQSFFVVLKNDTEFFEGFISRNKVSELLNRRPMSSNVQTTDNTGLDPLRSASAPVDSTFDLFDYIHPTTFTLNYDTPPVLMLKLFKDAGITNLALLNHGKLHGVLTKIDIIEYAKKCKTHTGNTYSELPTGVTYETDIFNRADD